MIGAYVEGIMNSILVPSYIESDYPELFEELEQLESNEFQVGHFNPFDTSFTYQKSTGRRIEYFEGDLRVSFIDLQTDLDQPTEDMRTQLNDLESFCHNFVSQVENSAEYQNALGNLSERPKLKYRITKGRNKFDNICIINELTILGLRLDFDLTYCV